MPTRELLLDTLAFMPPARILGDITVEDAGTRAAPGTHTIAELVAHLTFWQDWFLSRCQGQGTPMVQSAADGWPPVTTADWPALRDRFMAGLATAAAMGDAPDVDQPLSPPIEFPPLATYTRRDALTHLAVHNAHHLGQVVTLRQVMGRWPPPGGGWTW